MFGGFTIPIGEDIENRFAANTPNPEQNLIAATEEPEKELDLSQYDWDLDLLPLLDQLPPIEADVLELHMRLHKRQDDIGEIFHLTQAAVSYMIGRATARLKFLLDRPKLTEDELRRLISPHLQAITVDFMVGVFFGASQVGVAAKLGQTQGRVRHHIIRATRLLGQVNDPQVFEVHQFFQRMINGKQWNMSHRTILAETWAARKGIDYSEVERVDYSDAVEVMGVDIPIPIPIEEPPAQSEVRVKPVVVQPKARPAPKPSKVKQTRANPEPKPDNLNNGQAGSGTWKAELDVFLRTHQWREIQPLLVQLPGTDGKLVELVHLGNSLVDTASILGVGLAGLYGTTQKVVKRLDYLLRRPPYTDSQLRLLLAKHFSDSIVDGLIIIYKHNSINGSNEARWATRKSPPKLEQIEDLELKPFCEFMIWVIKGQHWNLLRKGPQGVNWRGRIKGQSQVQPATA